MLIRNSKTAWGLVSIGFHWVMAVLFLGQFGLGWYMQGVPSLVTQFNLYQWHKSFGFLILGLVVLRAIWALSSMRPALPDSLNQGERRLAAATHMILYALLFAVPLTGWAVASTSPLKIPSFVFNLFVMPNLPLSISLNAEQMWGSLHALLAYGAIFLTGVHIIAALMHHFHYRDSTLIRMVRPGHGDMSDDK